MGDEPKSIADLKQDPKNARKHTPRNVGMIVSALHEVGAARSIVIDEDGVVLAGNATIEAAAEAGIERVQVVDADGETIVAVRRRGLTPEQKARLALYDNRATDLSEFDPVQLAKLAEAGVPVEGIWSEDEWRALLEQAGAQLDSAPPDVEFKEYDESVEKDVEYITCPECGHKWPK